MAENTQHQKTIIIVEDDSVLYEAMRMYLRRYGWNCEWYAYAPTSMDEVRGLRAEAAIIDVNLPAGNGIDLINRMTADGVDFPIVVITGDINAAEQVRANGLANVQVLMKPFDLSNLQNLLPQAANAAA